MPENTYSTIIVGGGIAGLTAAAYLTRAGQKVLLIEKNKECGGLVNSIRRDGFHFDTGVKALEDAGIIFPMSILTGKLAADKALKQIRKFRNR